MQDSKQHEKQVVAAHSNTTCGSPRWGHMLFKGVFIATQLNWTQLTQLNSVQPSQSCFCLWRHDLQTESTVVHAVELSSVELSCVAINGPLDKRHIKHSDVLACACGNVTTSYIIAKLSQKVCIFAATFYYMKHVGHCFTRVHAFFTKICTTNDCHISATVTLTFDLVT